MKIKKIAAILSVLCVASGLIACDGQSVGKQNTPTTQATQQSSQAATQQTEQATVQPTLPSTQEPTEEPTMKAPQAKLDQIYSGYVLVTDSTERVYVQKAVQSFEEYISTALNKQTQADQNTLTVYIGKNSVQNAQDAAYVIKQDGNSIWLYGSNAENTYIAVSRYINSLTLADPQNISVLGEFEIKQEQVERSQYIADITKFETVWQYEWAPPEWMLDFGEKILTLLDASSRPICYAHRGDVEHYPENSIEGIISAIKKGADLVEVDVYLSKDGVPVLNHGTDLSVTTDWALKRGTTVDGVLLPTSKDIPNWTYEQLQKLNLRTGNGEYADGENSEITEYKIPTLVEVFTVCKERAFILIDKLTSDDWNMVLNIIKQTENGRSFIYTDMAKSRAEAERMQAEVAAAVGKSAPHLWTRGMKWAGTWFDEFSLKTTEQFEQYYTQQLAIGDIISTNRVCKLIDYIAKNYKSTRDKYK